jgi:hypothetical protein
MKPKNHADNTMLLEIFKYDKETKLNSDGSYKAGKYDSSLGVLARYCNSWMPNPFSNRDGY